MPLWMRRKRACLGSDTDLCPFNEQGLCYTDISWLTVRKDLYLATRDDGIISASR
jgi:hypothetical protein